MGDLLTAFLVSVGASVLGYYIYSGKEGPACGRIPCRYSKWLDRNN